MSTAAPRPRIEPVIVSDEFTVVGLYHSTHGEEQNYQSEAALEDDLIKQLCAQAYEYADIHDRDGLEANLRVQLEALNDYRFSDEEWKRFYRHSIVEAPSADGNPVVAKARRIQEDHVQVLTRDDGTPKNISLIDKTNIHRNKVQVIHQYAVDTGLRSNRYDVTVLVNGLPLVHIELKRRGEDLRQAFNQIDRYQRDSFHAGDGLFGYVQIFVISNGAHTKYYSNTVRLAHIRENVGGRREVAAANTHSYEFTSWWTDAANNQIPDLADFAATFLAKRTILAILTRYCVLNTSGQLLVMRPYQIAATEAILQRIKTSSMNKQTGSVAAGGYIWHTTGSGKTLTSFKTAKLAAGMEGSTKSSSSSTARILTIKLSASTTRMPRGPSPPTNPHGSSLSRSMTNLSQSSSPPSKSLLPSLRITTGTPSTPGTSSSSSMNATAVSLAICTLTSRERFAITTFSASPERPSSRKMPPAPEKQICAPPSRPSGTSCTPTRSSMLFGTRPSCRSVSTT